MSSGRLRWLFALAVAAGLSAFAGPRPDQISEAKARLQNADQALADEDLPTAKQELEKVRSLVPDSLDVVQYLEGRVAFEEGRYPEAIGLLTKAGAEDKPGGYLKLAKETLAVVKDHASQESEHFIFLYPRGKDEVLAPYALQTLEAIRSSLLHILGYAPPGKVRVEVVNDAKELSHVSTLTFEQINTTGTIAICKFNKLMVTSPKAVASGYDWQDTLAHEYTHLVVTQKGHNSVPIWLQEGLAKYLETAWRGSPGQSLSPSQRGFVAQRIKENKLVPFAKMHPSMAMLPTWQDANTAFAEVFYAADYIYKEKGPGGLKAIVDGMAHGLTDQAAVEEAMGTTFAGFEKAWMAYMKSQPVPKEFIPPTDGKVVLKSSPAGQAKEKEKDAAKGKEISFQDFAEVDEAGPRKLAHLGELFRERNRIPAATEEFGKAHRLVGDKYESVSNKYALTLMAQHRLAEAETVLQGSLRMHPGSAQTQVHLGRIYLARREFGRAKSAYLGALAEDPFDPEIHLALLRVSEGLPDPALAERARKAAVLLTGWPVDRVVGVARSLAPENGVPEAQVDSRKHGG